MMKRNQEFFVDNEEPSPKKRWWHRLRSSRTRRFITRK